MTVSPLLVLLRGVSVAALLSAFGTLAFVRLIAPPEPVLVRGLHRVAAWSAALALVLGLAWLAAEAGAVAGAGGPLRAFESIPEMLRYFRFARLLLVRLVLVAAVLALLLGARLARTQLALATAAVALQPLLAHAGAIFGTRGNVLVASEIVHLLAAGGWAGGLLPLLLSLRALPVPDRGRALRRFSRLGLIVVLTLIVTGLIQLGVLTRGFGGLFSTFYGAAIGVKLALFAAALLLATLNRSILTARLLGRQPAEALRTISVSVAAEAACVLGIVLAAGWLGSLAPA